MKMLCPIGVIFVHFCPLYTSKITTLGQYVCYYQTSGEGEELIMNVFGMVPWELLHIDKP